MPGLVTFRDLAEALAQGFDVYDKIDVGFLVRKRTDAGFALAIVDLAHG